jgi:hypothetical protein
LWLCLSSYAEAWEATALCRGDSRWLLWWRALRLGRPRPCAVETHVSCKVSC